MEKLKTHLERLRKFSDVPDMVRRVVIPDFSFKSGLPFGSRFFMSTDRK